jgi:signal transduction histidine kinase/DNA-binding LacI/PurR family transcriptional regulator
LRKGNARPTIGLFIAEIHRPYNIQQWRGISDGARRRGIDLMCFPGGLLRARNEDDAQANILYELASDERLDGLVIWTAGFDSYLTPSEVEAFSSRYRPIPVVGVENPISGIPSILMDNYDAIHEIISHLVEVHGYRRIAYIRSMATGHPGILERYRAYTETLAEYGIPFDPDLVSPPFVFEARSFNPAIVEWLGRMKKVGKLAIVGFNDMPCMKLLDIAPSLGIRFPEDMALTGFDDIDEGRVVTPPLTTTRPPFYEMGLEAVDLLIDLIEGKPVAEPARFHVPVIIRRSCGCQDPSVCRAAIGMAARDFASAGQFSASLRERALGAITEAAGEISCVVEAGWQARLFDYFLDDVKERTRGSFLSELEKQLNMAHSANTGIFVWQEAVSEMRKAVIPNLDADEGRRAEDILQQARVMLAHAAQRQEALRSQKTLKRMEVLREIQAALITTFDIRGLNDILAESLPQLGIPGCYLSLYENPRPYHYPLPAPEKSHLILAFNAKERIELESEERDFSSRRLVPDAIWHEEGPVAYVAEPLFFQKSQLGFALFEVGTRDGVVYETLRALISSALEGALLLMKEQKRAGQLQAASIVSRTLSSILGSEELIEQVVKQIYDLFHFPSVRLYLVDETTRRVILQANAGSSGKAESREGEGCGTRQDSLVEACVADALAGIRIEASSYPASLLSRDRSEIALPLVSRAAVIGALSVCSGAKTAFAEDEVKVIQTMADQIANAIENARLHADEKERSRELGEAYRALKENQERSLIAEKMASLGRLTAGIAHEMGTLLAASRASLVEAEKLANEYMDSVGDHEVTEEDHRQIAAEMGASIRLANTATGRAASFVQGIRTQTRNTGKDERQRFDAIPVIEESLLLLSHALRKADCTASFNPSVKNAEVVGSPGRLAQVVTNLVSNAIDAYGGEPGSTIILDIGPESDGVVLRIMDRGVGIPPENLSKIFEPLFTTKPIGQGTGLGLTIVHDIVIGEFGGTIDVASSPGKGTTFTLRFPRPAG